MYVTLYYFIGREVRVAGLVVGRIKCTNYARVHLLSTEINAEKAFGPMDV